ncbi:MAG: electron transport complex subunit RsxC [Planctomycetales bacterium 4484_123]|nr:MAG: electron transport complex subunit RsxC [Planctomycetales bacterium 4484_123]
MVSSAIPGTGRFARGLHPDDKKSISAGAGIEVLPTPKSVLIPLLQHIGAPCEPAVKPRAEVRLGQAVGEAKAFVSAPVHASIDGKTAAATVTTLPNGRHVAAIPITAAEEQSLSGQALWEDIYGGQWPTDGLGSFDPEQIVTAVRSAGLVGMGGAAFPTHVKLTPNEKRPVDTLVVNGCECEPYLTADHRLMLEAPAPIITGALLAARAAGAERIIVAIEDNKPDAAEAMAAAAEGTPVQVAIVQTRYPMGGERQLIPAVLGREVPTGGLPLDVGVVVVNVATAAAIARAVIRGKPLTHRVVSVTGEGINQPKNLLVPLGASYAELVAFCGGLADSAGRVIAGGPMMGFALAELDVPVTKGTSGVVVLTEEQLRRAEQTACLRCGRCVDVCPAGLVPTKIALAARHQDWETARRYYLTACFECGCCAYVCPANIPLVQLIRTGKATMPKE